MTKNISKVEVATIADLRANSANAEGKVYGARKAYAEGLNAYLPEGWYDQETKSEAAEVTAERKAYVELCALFGHPTGTTIASMNGDVRKVALRRGESNWSNVKNAARKAVKDAEAAAEAGDEGEKRGTPNARDGYAIYSFKRIIDILKRGERDIAAKERKCSPEEQAFNVALFKFMTENPAAIALYKQTTGSLDRVIGAK
jgi:hypothetical protein